MGASGWNHVAPWQGSIIEAMTALQNDILAEHFSHLPESMGIQGTHTLLDLPELVPVETDPDEVWGAVHPVCEAEIVEAFDHDRPTRAEFDRLGDSPLLDDADRWTGRCLVLYRDGLPKSVVFWGASGD